MFRNTNKQTGQNSTQNNGNEVNNDITTDSGDVTNDEIPDPTVEELNSISPVRHRMTSLRTDSQRLLVASKPISRTRAIERAHKVSFLNKEVSCVTRITRSRTTVLEEQLGPLRKLLLRKVM